jgi:hypothetical protein
VKTAREVAEYLVSKLRGLNETDAAALLDAALEGSEPEEIVAIAQHMPPALRPLMPKRHLN